MKLDLAFEDRGDYLYVRVKGKWERQEIIDGIKNVAVNHSANFMVLSDFDEAVRWLTGASPQ